MSAYQRHFQDYRNTKDENIVSWLITTVKILGLGAIVSGAIFLLGAGIAYITGITPIAALAGIVAALCWTFFVATAAGGMDHN